jgi:hypothetical protein
VPHQAAGPAPGQLGHVGVLLLREHGGAGGPGVVEDEEPELLARPQHHLLAQPAQVDAQEGQREQRFGHEVAIRHGVEAVLEGGGEAEVGRHPHRVERQGGAGQRARAQGADVEPPAGVEQSLDVAAEGPAVGQQVVGQQHR